MADELGVVEVGVRANLDQFERGLATGLRDAQTFSQRATKLFGTAASSMQQINEQAEMSARSMRLFNSELDNTAKAIMKATAERQKMGQAFQANLNASFGIGKTGNSGARAEDIKAYGQALDELKAKYVPLFSVQKQYEVELENINTAHRLGAITSEEHAAALLHANRTYELAAASARKVGGTMKANAFQTGNLAAQFNDIAVTLAGGMNSWLIALQQGTQINQVISRFNLKEVGSMLAGAFTQLLNPLSLATIAIIGFGGAALQWLTSTSDGVKTLDDVLKRHEENIKRLGPAYDEAAIHAKKYVTESADVVNSLLKIDSDAMADQLHDQIFASMQKAKVKVSSSVGGSLFTYFFSNTGNSFLQDMVGSLTQLGPQFKPFESLVKSLESGAISVTKFRAEVEKLGQSSASLRAPANELLSFTNEAQVAESKIFGAAKSVDEFALAFGKLEGSINKVDNAAVQEEMKRLADETKKGSFTVEDLEKALKSLSGVNPDMSGVISQFGDLAKAAIMAREAIGQVTLAQGLAGQFSDKAGIKGSRISPLTDDEKKAVMDRQQQIFNQQIEFVKRTGEIEKAFGISNKKLPNERKGGKTDAERDAEAYRNLIKNGQDRVDQLRLESETLGMAATKAEKLRFEQKMLADATDKGRTINEKQRAEIKALAEEYGKYAEAIASATLKQDIMFERQQMFRSSTDQRIAEQLKAAGLEVDFNSLEAGWIRTNAQLETARDLTMDFASGIKNDLMNGVSAVDALGNAFGRLGDKLLDMALDTAINGLFKNLLGGVSGLFGGGGGGTSFNPFQDIFASAHGNTFRGGQITPFKKGGVVSSPVIFPMKNGAGLAGEAGDEGILPLRRNSQGDLGVISSGGSGSVNVTFAPSYNVTGYGEDIEGLKRQMAKDRVEFESRTIKAVRDAQKGNKL